MGYDVLTQISLDSSHLSVITQVSLKGVLDSWIDTTVAEIETLKPVYHSSYNRQREIVLNFGRVISGYYLDKSKTQKTAIIDSISKDYFDSNLYPLVISWLPLEDDYKQTISIYDYNPFGKKGVIKANIKDVRSEMYESNLSGTQQVWTVTVVDEISNNSDTYTIYYIGKSDRRLWKQETNTANKKIIMQFDEQKIVQ